MANSKKLLQAENALELVQTQTNALQKQYISELETNPKYSLSVDPENKYEMPDIQKKFIKFYVDYKNVNTAADLAEIDGDTAKRFFIAYGTQNEIRRINLALYHRQFATRLLDLDEIGGYLTCLLTGENVPVGDQLKTGEKLKVVELLIKLNELKQNSLLDPTIVMAKDIDVQIKNLSIATIKQLINQDVNMKERNNVVAEFSEHDLTPEETAYLSTLPTKDLLQLIDDTNKKEGMNDVDK